MSKAEKAKALFMEGANCAQAVCGAFAAECGISEEQALILSSGFGGGVGRMREVCGAVSGMVLVLNMLYGAGNAGDKNAKDSHYARIQSVANAFKTECGSIVCREILKNPPSDPNPTPRTAEFYKTRPCARMVMTAAKILDDYIAEHPVE